MVSDGSRWSKKDSSRRSSGTRRTASVTISAPEALCAAFISSKLRYLPVPTMRRDENGRPPTSNFSGEMETAVDMNENLHLPRRKEKRRVRDDGGRAFS